MVEYVVSLYFDLLLFACGEKEQVTWVVVVSIKHIPVLSSPIFSSISLNWLLIDNARYSIFPPCITLFVGGSQEGMYYESWSIGLCFDELCHDGRKFEIV